MSYVKIQGKEERQRGIYYQVNSDDQPIGTGGMGRVFKGVCVDERTGSSRPVAIKFMYADLPEHAIERARREASIQLRNDNLVEMLGFIELEEQTVTGEVHKHYHVVSELLTGVSLSDVLEGKTKDRDGQDVPFAIKMAQDFRNDPEHFARIVVINVLSGLMALHDAGYIHRDIDPSNIMLTTDGHIKLIDFGIAKQMNNLTTNDKGLTVAGSFMGKPEYAAPELALGDVKSQNQTTDIYAVGILLYQCIIGHTPFEGARHEILEKQLKAKLPLDKIENRGLRKVIATACEKKQELRYQSSAQMRVALEELANVKNKSLVRIGTDKGKLLLIAGVLAMVIIGVAITLRVKHSNAVKREQIQLALQQEELRRDSIAMQYHILIEDAEKAMMSGQNVELDNYEDFLIEAYKNYDEAQTYAEELQDESAKNHIALRKNTIVSLLEMAKEKLMEQSVTLAQYNEKELAQVYSLRADKIQAYLNSISIEQESNGIVENTESVDSVVVE